MDLAAVRSAHYAFLQPERVQKVILDCPYKVEELKPKRQANLKNTKYGHTMDHSLSIDETEIDFEEYNILIKVFSQSDQN